MEVLVQHKIQGWRRPRQPRSKQKWTMVKLADTSQLGQKDFATLRDTLCGYADIHEVRPTLEGLLVRHEGIGFRILQMRVREVEQRLYAA